MTNMTKERIADIWYSVCYSTRILKHRCFKCKQMATWYYMPASVDKHKPSSYYCDDCVSRGCGCNIIDDTGTDPTYEQYKDLTGRELPCCEYNYNEEGYKMDWMTALNRAWFNVMRVFRMGE